MNRQASKLDNLLAKKIGKKVAPPAPPKEPRGKKPKGRKAIGAPGVFSGPKDYRLAKKYTCHKLDEILTTRNREIRDKMGASEGRPLSAQDFISWLELQEAEPLEGKAAARKVSAEASSLSTSRKTRISDPHSVFEKFKPKAPETT